MVVCYKSGSVVLNSFEVIYLGACMWVPNTVGEAYCRLCLLLQVCMDLSSYSSKTFYDFEVISEICFAQDNLESNFTPRYE